MSRRPRASDEVLVELFLDMLAAERGAGENTLAAYRNDLEDLSAHLRASAQHDRRRDDRRPARLYCQPFRPRLQGVFAGAAIVGGAPAFSVFSMRKVNASDDPAAVLEGPKRGRPLAQGAFDRRRRCASQAGAERTARTPISRAPQRLRAARLLCLLEVVYATGLRVSELVALPASAARRDQRMLVVRGKGGKERLVPLNKQAKRAMAEYLELRGKTEGDAQSKWLFPSFGETRVTSPGSISHASSRRSDTACGIQPCAPEPACAASRLRQPSAAQWRRSARGADSARTCRYFDDANLYACAGRTAENAGARPAPFGRWLAKSIGKSEINPFA